jgi:structure-specific endonuclease subunit SLX1
MWSVYLLQEVGGTRTYIGATLDVTRRLQQHNGIQSGGAKATRGKQWSRICHITGFPDEKAALQFEWSWKYTSRKQEGRPFERRIKALFVLLGCDQPTSKATDFQTYVKDLEVVWETGLDPMKFV